MSIFCYVEHFKGQLISKGIFAVFICTKNERKYFSISALKIRILFQNNTFVGSSPTQGNTFFLKSDLKWAFSDILIHFQCSNLIFVEL